MTSPEIAPPTSDAARERGRITEFDALRGLAILCVMYLHAYFGPWVTTPRSELITLHITQIFANSAVPLFLFMSGFLGARDRSPDFRSLARGRLRRLAVPLLFWMLAALAFEVVGAGRITGEMLAKFALFDISGQFYYVVVLLVLTMALYPLRFAGTRDLRRFTIAAFAVNVAAITAYRVYEVDGFWWTLAYRNPLVWVFSYTFGLYVARTRGDVRFPPGQVAAAAVGMVASAAMYLYIGEEGWGYPESYFGVTVFLFAVCGFVVYPAVVRAIETTAAGRWMLAPFRALAPYAFGIYLVHKPYFVGQLSDRLISGTFLANDYLQLVGSLFLVGGAVSIAAVVLAGRLFPRFAAVLLGVEGPGRPGAPAAS